MYRLGTIFSLNSSADRARELFKPSEDVKS